MSGVVVVVLLFALLAPLALYLLIREETASTTITERAEAEREARTFGGIDDRNHSSADEGASSTDRSNTSAGATSDEAHEWGGSRLDEDRNQ